MKDDMGRSAWVFRSPMPRHITLQEEHHRKASFQEEYVSFLKRHHVPYDERYLWG